MRGPHSGHSRRTRRIFPARRPTLSPGGTNTAGGVGRLMYAVITLVACALFAVPARAGEITMAVRTNVSVSDRDVVMEFTLSNHGSDPAGEVQVIVEFQGETRSVSAAKVINPEESATAKTTFTLPEGAKGAFPVYARTRYKDPGGATFGTVVLGIARTREDAPVGPVKMTVTRGYGKKWGKVHADIFSRDPGVKSVLVRCHCPEDLAVAPASRVVKISGGEGQGRFSLTNVQAMSGSRYTTFCVAEYVTTASTTPMICPSVSRWRATPPKKRAWGKGDREPGKDSTSAVGPGCFSRR